MAKTSPTRLLDRDLPAPPLPLFNKSGHVGARKAQSVDKSRIPRTFRGERFCTEEGCNVKLASYNKGPKCYLHSPVRYPRVRGYIDKP